MSLELLRLLENQIDQARSFLNAKAVTEEERNLLSPTLPPWFLEELEADTRGDRS